MNWFPTHIFTKQIDQKHESIVFSTDNTTLKLSTFQWIKHYMASKISTNAPFRLKMNEKDFLSEFDKDILNRFGLSLSNVTIGNGFACIEFNPENASSVETADVSNDIEGTKRYIMNKLNENGPLSVKMKEKHYDQNFMLFIDSLRSFPVKVLFENGTATITNK
ncbi:hypothetical protein BK120_23330 [Paenibacillus sp. FSL A5-0031]|uniref:hypothetical protein n=1 Tax=Paenibacillus sp. FSL A5-0031 TaxID=1920420 RepID=UPI00096C38FB|nr:hypothetical protein [Paenibacillus sp. FSL A5-0031]OME78674.1 hypothetical protein BK120_23330 [Paenibacillus sp. FSL A5-0031]